MTNEMHDWDGCLMCAVRALTQGRAREWGAVSMPELKAGDSVTGVVLRQGNQPSHFAGQVPFIELWTGAIDRVRVTGHGTVLRLAILSQELEVGDTVTVTFDGEKEIKGGKYADKTFKAYTVDVKRGHH